jgi:hypothetical protein
MKYNQKRISKIIHKLALLTLETSRLTHELQELEGSSTQTNANVNQSKKGDEVVITNDYRARDKGRTGIITRVSKR